MHSAVRVNLQGFNPAEAEEGFRSNNIFFNCSDCVNVSIQPKPKKGLEGSIEITYNPSNREVSIQPKPKKGLEAST